MIAEMVRKILGVAVLAVDRTFEPKQIKHRSSEEKTQLKQQLANHSVYQFESCPFCVKVRRALKRLDLEVELRDARNNPIHKKELVEKGGEFQVPCLRVDFPDGTTKWMYESDDIIRYFETQFP